MARSSPLSTYFNADREREANADPGGPSKNETKVPVLNRLIKEGPKPSNVHPTKRSLHVTGFGDGISCEAIRALFEEEDVSVVAVSMMAAEPNIARVPGVSLLGLLRPQSNAAVVEMATVEDAVIAQRKLQGTPVGGEPSRAILIRFVKCVHGSGGNATGVVIPPKRMRKIRRRARQPVFICKTLPSRC